MKKVIGISQTPHELIKRLVKEGGPNGGSIFLDDFCELCPDSTRQECVAALKSNKDVLFISGRKGHMSRAVFGELRNSYHQAPSFRSPVASGPIRHMSNRQPRSVVSNDISELNPQKFRVRLVVQGQEFYVPIEELQLVSAA